MKNIDLHFPEKKADRYNMLNAQMRELLKGEEDLTANLANASALLNEALEAINWGGFYLVKNGELVLGPFQGKVACVRIALGKGVCGTAALENKTQVVDNVHQFPGHIACDSASNSELVVPIRKAGKVVGVLDIDSPEYGRFDSVDSEGLERVVRTIEEACDFENQ